MTGLRALNRKLRWNHTYFRGCRKSSSTTTTTPSKITPLLSKTGDSVSSSRPWPSVKLVFLGCPGVGKGTYAKMLSRHLGVPHIAMGDLVRHELSTSSPQAAQLKRLVSQGKLVSDDIVLELMSKRLTKVSEDGETGYILDGFPRTQYQAEKLDKMTDIDLVLNLRLREDILILKCLGRRICSGCGSNFNLTDVDVKGMNGSPPILMPALLPPPACQSKLTIREDDTEEVVRERLKIYAQESKPIEDYYRKQGKLLDFDVGAGIPETWPKLLRSLALAMHAKTIA